MAAEETGILHWKKVLPEKGIPSHLYFLQSGNGFKLFVSDVAGFLKPLQVELQEATDYGLEGLQDGQNRVFKTKSHSKYVPGTTKLYLNGIRQYRGDDYEELDTEYIEFLKPPRPTAKIIMDYYLNQN